MMVRRPDMMISDSYQICGCIGCEDKSYEDHILKDEDDIEPHYKQLSIEEVYIKSDDEGDDTDDGSSFADDVTIENRIDDDGDDDDDDDDGDDDFKDVEDVEEIEDDDNHSFSSSSDDRMDESQSSDDDDDFNVFGDFDVDEDEDEGFGDEDDSDQDEDDDMMY